MRLGEMLIRQGRIKPDQLEGALRAQVYYGARIGTNLIEQNLVNVDEITAALSTQKGVSGAYRRHFDAIQPSVSGLIPADLAKKHSAIPLGVPRAAQRELAVAFCDPNDIAAVDEIAFATGRRIRPCVASELRILYYLEAIYGVTRGNRYMRVHPNVSGAKAAIDLTPDSREPERRRYARLTPDLGPESPVPAQAPPAPPAPPTDDAGFDTVRLSSYMGPLPTAELPSVGTDADAISSFDLTANQGVRSAGRQAPRPTYEQPAVMPVEAEPAVIPEPDAEEPVEIFNAAQALAKIQAATQRDDIAAAIGGYLRAHTSCGLILICREQLGLGWRGFAPSVDDSVIGSVTIPLVVTSVFEAAYDSKAPYHGAPIEEGKSVQTRLWKLLQVPVPREVVVAPVVIGGRVVNLVYAHGGENAAIGPHVVTELFNLCSAAATQFTALIRAAKSGG